MRCTTCHPAANYDAVGMPGHPNWHLAPLSMAWQGKSLAEIVQHVTHDPLVGWAWSPGTAREPAPGTQQAFGDPRWRYSVEFGARPDVTQRQASRTPLYA